MPKITKAGGPSHEGDVPADTPVIEIPTVEAVAEPEPEPVAEPTPAKPPRGRRGKA